MSCLLGLALILRALRTFLGCGLAAAVSTTSTPSSPPASGVRSSNMSSSPVPSLQRVGRWISHLLTSSPGSSVAAATTLALLPLTSPSALVPRRDTRDLAALTPALSPALGTPIPHPISL